MQKRLVIESTPGSANTINKRVRESMEAKINYPSDMGRWCYDLMYDYIESCDWSAMSEISDAICESKVLTAAEKKKLTMLTERRFEKAVTGR